MKTLGLRDLFKSIGLGILVLVIAILLVGVWFIVSGSLAR
jgi:hypothetical protein